MIFDLNSPLVKNYLILIKAKEKTIEDVPNVGNLREVLTNALAQSN